MPGFEGSRPQGRRWRRHVTFWVPDELFEAIESFRLAKNLDFSTAARTLISNALAMEKSKQPRSRALKSQSAGDVDSNKIGFDQMKFTESMEEKNDERRTNLESIST